MNLKSYSPGDFTPGASLSKQLLWHFFGCPLVESRLLPFSRLKVAVLRAFGAAIGQGVRIKPGVRVKFPWRLSIGDFSWIGEDVWIDNLAPVTIGRNVCISQGVYLCTGSHDYSKEGFDLIVKPITIGEKAWLAAKSSVVPGVTIGEGAVLLLAGVAAGELAPWRIYQGNPAVPVRDRKNGP